MDITALARNQASDVEGSFSRRMREKRFAQFEQFAEQLPRPLQIVDLGGTNEYWESRGWAGREDVQITLVNLDDSVTPRHENITPTIGDATAVDAPDGAYDLVFSNSVIEHLFTRDKQAEMAREVRRLAPAYWVQTPNYWFPVEPHFFVPAWHWLPESLRVEILMRRGVGWAGRCPERAKATAVVQEHRLMRRRELAALFPGATLMPERIAGLTKSWTAVHV